MPEQNFTSNADFVVPTGITSLVIECWGSGGTTSGYASGGSYAKGTYTVTPAETLKVHCGGWGTAGDVRRGGDALANRIIVAGAAGGSGVGQASHDDEGDPGFPHYVNGGEFVGSGASGTGPSAGGDGTALAGGAGGSGGSSSGADADAGTSGTLGFGGTGGHSSDFDYVQGGTSSGTGGDGGDGYYGGGGGGAQARAGFYNSTWGWGRDGGRGSSYTGTGTSAVTNTNARVGSSIVKISWSVVANNAPNAPLLITPVDGAVLTTADDIPVEWEFSDPDVGNTQSRWELEVRAQGSGVNTIDLDSASPPGSGYAAGITGTDVSIVVPAGTLVADDWEFRVRTYDQAPLVGAWSSWRPFSVVAPPTAPTITAPANLSTITTGTAAVTWTVTNQDAYEIQRLLDSDSSVLWHSGTIENTSARSHTVDFPTDGQTENVQVRVRYGGLWSSWSSVEITTDFVPPMTPTIVVTPIPEQGLMRIAITHPTPSGGAPAVAMTNVWVRQAGGRSDDWVRPSDDVGVRIGANVSTAFSDYFAASETVYEYRVQALAASGVGAYSAWVAGTLSLEALFINDPDVPADNVTMWLGEESEDFDTGAEVRAYGGGRRRSITRPGANRAGEFEVALMDHSTYYNLRSKTSRTVLLRTPRGKKIWGMISALSAPERRDRNYVACSFSITETTHSEVV